MALNINLDRILPVFAPLVRGAIRPSQKAREEQFRTVPRLVDRVVFLGDSITQRGPWEDWFPELPTANRGIDGQTVGDVLNRLETAITDPRAVSIMIGTNNLHGLGGPREPSAIAELFDQLILHIREMAPDAPIFVNSVFPRSLHFRDRILKLNESYREIAARNDATYIDVWPALATPEGAIRRELSPDGIHVNSLGYLAWVEVLRPNLRPFAMKRG